MRSEDVDIIDENNEEDDIGTPGTVTELSDEDTLPISIIFTLLSETRGVSVEQPAITQADIASDAATVIFFIFYSPIYLYNLIIILIISHYMFKVKGFCQIFALQKKILHQFHKNNNLSS